MGRFGAIPKRNYGRVGGIVNRKCGVIWWNCEEEC